MSAMLVFVVLLLAVFHIKIHSANDKEFWTKEQMEYLDNIKGDYQREIEELKRELYYLKHSIRLSGHSKKRNTDIRDNEKYQRLLSEAMPVAFYVHLSGNININGNQAIPYDIVKVNVGNGYNHFSGHFQAPIAGLYHFSNTVMSEPGHGIHVEIVKNGITIGKNWADHNGYESGSVSVIADLDAGDLVWVKDSDNGLEHLEHDYNSFTGFLISPRS